ncbi:MAG: SH3 domain-containing protein [Archangium sp.]|nr:SH3 domain-containing protein [Archangium sp.]MDP3156275.1 SH3 domain-containing protein [Archangium sp.]MDP3570319.1 SH3 domain-containing protein [Archangium sp.]
MIALVLALTLAQYTPQESQALFVEGNDAYYKGDYAGAKERYEKLLQAGFGGPDVLFNLGTTHLAAGELGPAILYLERAHRLSDDDDIGANLAVARQRQVDQVVGEEGSVPFTQRLAEATDERIVGIAFLIVWWLGFALLWFTARSSSRVVLGLITALFLVVGAGLGGTLAVHEWVQDTVIEAVVMPEAAKVREYPGETAKVSFEVHAGLKLRIMETSGRYVRVRLPNALEGWTEKEGLVSL